MTLLEIFHLNIREVSIGTTVTAINIEAATAKLIVKINSLNSSEINPPINKNGNTILMATHDYALLLKYPSKTLKCDENQVFEVVQRRN